MSAIKREYPPGAVKQLSEITTTRVHTVSRSGGLETINHENLPDLQSSLKNGWNIGEDSHAYPYDFVFLNYWFAHGYAVRLKKELGGWVRKKRSLV